MDAGNDARFLLLLREGVLFLRIVDGASKALFAGGILHFFEMFLQLFQLCLHGFHLVLLLLLAFVPLHASGNAIASGIANGFVEDVHLALQGSDGVLLSLNLGLPLFRGALPIALAWLRVRCTRSLESACGTSGGPHMLGNLVVGDDVSSLRLSIFYGCVRERRILGLRVFRGCIFGLSVLLLFLQPGLASHISERWCILTERLAGAQESAGC